MRGRWKQARLNMRAGSSAADARVGTLARDALATPEHSPSPQARRRRAPPPLRTPHRSTQLCAARVLHRRSVRIHLVDLPCLQPLGVGSCLALQLPTLSACAGAACCARERCTPRRPRSALCAGPQSWTSEVQGVQRLRGFAPALDRGRRSAGGLAGLRGSFYPSNPLLCMLARRYIKKN